MGSLNLTHQAISRQLDLVPPSILDKPVTIIGAGAIGSWTTLALAKMGFKNITVFDHDEVDIVNMSSQFYGIVDIGEKKAESLKFNIREISDIEISSVNERWNGMKLNGIVVMAVDSMKTRKQIFEAHKFSAGTDWLIDARMGAETMLLYAINPSSSTDQAFYEKTLYTDEEAMQAPCTAKSTTYCALICSGLVAKTVRDVIMRQPYLRNLSFSLKGNDWLAFPRTFG